MLTGQIKCFQEKNPDLAAYSSKGFIFYCEKEDGRLWGYDVEVINNIFEDGFDKTNPVQTALISLMVDIQACYELHDKNPTAGAPVYEEPGEEYRAHYEALLYGISDKAVDVISCHNKPYANDSLFKTGAIFARKLRNERRRLGIFLPPPPAYLTYEP